MAVKNQAHPRDPQNAGNQILESVWCHMATPNFTLINSLCCCFDLILLFKFVGFRKVLHFWGNIKMIIRKQSNLAQHPTNFLAPTNQNNNKGCWSGWSWGLPCGTKLTPESDSWRSEGHEYVFGFSRPSRTRLTLSQDGVSLFPIKKCCYQVLTRVLGP